MLTSSNLGLGFGNGQAPSSLPLMTSITGESSVSEYQDCGLSPMFLTAGDSRWDSNFEAMSSPQARDKAKMRYNEKKKTRTYVIYSIFRFILCFKSYHAFVGFDMWSELDFFPFLFI